MIAYKLFRVRKDCSIGSLFVNRCARLGLNEWMKAEPRRTKGFAIVPVGMPC